MNRFVAAILLAFSLASTASAEEIGWFVETASDNATFASDLLVFDPEAERDDNDVLNLRAGFRLGDAFSISAAIDKYLLDTTRGESCAAGNFVCLAARDRDIVLGRGYTVSLAPALRLDDDLSIYGHLGIQGWDVEAGGGQLPNRRELMFGVGLGYDISNPFRVQFEYRSMDLDIKLTSVGFTWRF